MFTRECLESIDQSLRMEALMKAGIRGHEMPEAGATCVIEVSSQHGRWRIQHEWTDSGLQAVGAEPVEESTSASPGLPGPGATMKIRLRFDLPADQARPYGNKPHMTPEWQRRRVCSESVAQLDAAGDANAIAKLEGPDPQGDWWLVIESSLDRDKALSALEKTFGDLGLGGDPRP